MLDDILSGLDKKIEQAVFQQVLGREGLCRKHGIAVVFATHAIKYLPYADHVVVFSEEGSISEQGPPKRLICQDLLIETATPQDNREGEKIAFTEEAFQKTNVLVTQDSQVASMRLVGDLKIYTYYTRAVGWMLLAYMCMELITTLLLKFPDTWLRFWSAAEVSSPREHTNFYLGIYCMLAGLCLCTMVISILILFTGKLLTHKLRYILI